MLQTNRRQRFPGLFHKDTYRNVAQPVGLMIVRYDIPQRIHSRGENLIFVVYETEGALQLVCTGDENTDLTVADIPFQKSYGNDGQTLIIEDGIAEGIRTGGFPGGARIQIVPFDETVKQCTGTASRFPYDELLVIEFFYMNLLPVGKGMVFGTSKNQKIADTWDHHQILVMNLSFHQPDIQFGPKQLFFDGMRISDKGISFRVRHSLGKIVQHMRDQTGTDGDGRSDADDIFLIAFLHGLLHLLKLTDHLIGVVQKLLPGRRNVESSGEPVKSLVP